MKNKINPKTCFLCGVDLTSINRPANTVYTEDEILHPVCNDCNDCNGERSEARRNKCLGPCGGETGYDFPGWNG